MGRRYARRRWNRIPPSGAEPVPVRVCTCTVLCARHVFERPRAYRSSVSAPRCSERERKPGDEAIPLARALSSRILAALNSRASAPGVNPAPAGPLDDCF